ncbi:MAG: glycosyl hydrolase, partial [Saprospiraceae bacterium]|nr:glycosyl hydrolase [Saprospiraceae bacterium]
MRQHLLIVFIAFMILPLNCVLSQEDSADTLELKHIDLLALSFRSIGPAITGGRIVALAVNPENTCEYYVGSGHGSLWKTSNCGTTFKPVFDGQKSYSIGAVTLDPSNPNVVWVGTGENNAQTNVIPGDGVYKSLDGGKSWTNTGLKESEHIGAIVVHPQDPNIVYVASYGPQRRSGGDVGVFRTKDGGDNWENVLFVSEHTGCWELHMDPRDPNLIYAVAHQRQKKLYTGVYGGPESGIYKTVDGGDNWTKLKGGLPTEDVGRIGMDISPADPDVLYAVVAAKNDEEKGFYKSTDRGASWSRQSGYVTSYPFYCQKIFCDPEDVDLIYAMDIFMQVSRDGGKSFSNLGTKYKHVDEHVLWIDPSNTSHMLSGCDGGLYETHDAGATWAFHDNIPITEIYKVTVDNSKPFYYVYVGTQDNNSLGGPSQTINSSGIMNRDWFFTWGGDGFETQVDWKDPDILYSQSQFGGLVRYDRQSGERLFIKPYEEGDTAYRFDWDAALLLSQHDNHRLYFGGNVVLRSDDQGSNWQKISPDLTRGVPQEMMRIMDRSWSIDEYARKSSMAQILTIAESPLDENILYAGSGDGLIHYTTNGGESWNRSEIKGLPEYANIRQIIASHHDVNIAYAACSNFLDGEYAPYLYKTTDGGATWNSINSNLPENGCTYTIDVDHEDPDLLFVGTQYGVFVSNTAEPKWVKLSRGIPNTMVMDLDIQRDEDDLVVSTFGRGVYILDDYSALRHTDHEVLNSEATLFPVSDARMYVEADPFGFPGVGFQGWNFYTADNPPVGTMIDYYIREKPKSLKEKRREVEKELQKEGKDIDYPDYKTRRAEADEVDPFLLFTIRDTEGNAIRKIKKPVKKGMQRLVWDFRYSPFTAIKLEPYDDSVPWNSPPQGYMVMPGDYSVEMGIFEKGKYRQLAEPRSFNCAPLGVGALTESDKAALDAFNQKVADLAVVLNGAETHRSYLSKRIPFMEKAILEGASVDPQLLVDVQKIQLQLSDLGRVINGDRLRASYEGATPMSVKGRIDLIT